MFGKLYLAYLTNLVYARLVIRIIKAVPYIAIVMSIVYI